MFGDMELRYQEVFAQMPPQEQGFASCSLGLPCNSGWLACGSLSEGRESGRIKD